jgi:uncharacterized membrane protein
MRRYTGYAYIKKLERCLRKMPYEERLDVVNYYSEYLAEAGPEHEQEVIERLGPPQRLAAEIRADSALNELNAKAEIAEKIKEARRAKEGNAGVEIENPKMGESISAAGLGAIGMLSMPVARPFAVLACVLGIIGLVLSVSVVVGLFIVAGALAISGLMIAIVSFILILQSVSVTLFLVGAGVALMGAGLLIGMLTSLLGHVIFKGIANLSGIIRHKRIKIRKENFSYTYTYTNAGVQDKPTP